jgi:hypothetical protein
METEKRTFASRSFVLAIRDWWGSPWGTNTMEVNPYDKMVQIEREAQKLNSNVRLYSTPDGTNLWPNRDPEGSIRCGWVAYLVEAGDPVLEGGRLSGLPQFGVTPDTPPTEVLVGI